MQIIPSQMEEKQLPETQISKETVKLKDPELNNKKQEGFYIKNAGLVLINHYIPMLFERLGIIDAQKSFLPNKQSEAAHYLQFVVTGLTDTEEHYLVLNKILSGIPLSEPVPNSIEISPNSIELIEQLLTAMIGYWPAIGSTSTNGFRGNWLVREGLLIEQDDKWELVVEKRPYDLLINQSPFTFSLIKYPWMNKPLYVKWAY